MVRCCHSPLALNVKCEVTGIHMVDNHCALLLSQELLASDPSDLLMNDMALRKGDVYNAFVNKELGAGAG